MLFGSVERRYKRSNNGNVTHVIIDVFDKRKIIAITYTQRFCVKKKNHP